MQNRKNKIRVGLVFGGKSGEHEVSIVSARSIYKALDKNKYEVTPIGINRTGSWCLPTSQKLLGSGNVYETNMVMTENSGGVSINQIMDEIDVFFPIVHGTYGEDGCLQGLIEMMGKPYVGAGVLGSAVGMDKEVQKRLLMQAGIRVARYTSLSLSLSLRLSKIKLPFEFPVFVKPANMGSSVGVSMVTSRQSLAVSIRKAFQYDTKILIEEYVEGREIEVAVLDSKASIPGEVIPKGKHKFYDYEAKYIDEKGARLDIPVKRLGLSLRKRIQKTAERVFRILECEGMARVDMFLTPGGEVVVNEINTLPGFTDKSMYTRLWEASGITYKQILNKLITLAIKRHSRKKKLIYHRE